MANHFTDIGFEVKDNSDVSLLAQNAYEKGEKISVNKGKYVLWKLKSGAEIWNQFNENEEFLSLSPAFSGESTRTVKLEKAIKGHENTLEGSFYAWSERIDNDPDSEGYPFMFDVPNFYTLPEYSLPKKVDIQLSAFANELKCFDSEKEFNEDKTGIRFASKSFIPSGLFAPGGKPIEKQRAEAIFAGQVIKWKKLKNEFTNKEFVWFLVETLGGSVDVVADRSLLNKEPVKGGYVMGVFWLSGRILNT